jgi:hypothetical protein
MTSLAFTDTVAETTQMPEEQDSVRHVSNSIAKSKIVLFVSGVSVCFYGNCLVDCKSFCAGWSLEYKDVEMRMVQK